MRSMLICASLALPFQMRQRNRSTSVMIIDLPPEKWTPGYADFRSACSGVM
jgi:hypothetical protein